MFSLSVCLKPKVKQKIKIMNDVKEVLIGAVTIAVGYVLASVIVNKVMGSATPAPAANPPATDTKTPAAGM